MNNNALDFYEIYDYYTVPFWHTTWFMVIIAFFIIALIGIIFFIIRRKKTISPSIWLEREVKKLNISSLQHKNDFKAFYFTLTHIIKVYLVRRYSWKVMDKTDDELVEFLERKQCDLVVIQAVQKIVTCAQSIKFANVDALRSEAEESLDDVKLIMEKTRPIE